MTGSGTVPLRRAIAQAWRRARWIVGFAAGARLVFPAGGRATPSGGRRLAVVAAGPPTLPLSAALRGQGEIVAWFTLGRDGANAVDLLGLAPNTAEDFEICRLANAAGDVLAARLFPDPGAAREVATVLLADLLHARLNRLAALAERIASAGVDRLVLAPDAAGLEDAVGIGAWLAAERNLPVVMIRPTIETGRQGGGAERGGEGAADWIRTAPVRLARRAAEPRLSETPAPLADAATLDTAAAAATEAAVRRLGALREPVLITASLRSSAYAVAAAELIAAFRGARDVVLLGDGAPREPADLTGAALVSVGDIAPVSPSDPARRAAAARAVAELLEALPANGADRVATALRASGAVIRRALSDNLQRELRRATAAATLLERIGAKAMVATPGRAPWVRGALLRARAANVPTLDCQALFISERPRYRPSCAAIYAAISTDQAALYRRAMRPPAQQRVEVVGSLLFDAARRAAATLDAATARRRGGLPVDGLIALFAAQRSGDSGVRALDVALEAAARSPGWLLLVRPHPHDDAAALEAIAERVGRALPPGRAIVSRDRPLYEQLLAADAVLTQYSNVGLEAAILDRPVVVIRAPEERYVVDLAALGLAMPTETPDALADALAALAANGAAAADLAARRAAFFAENPALREGGAARRAAALVAP